LNAVCTPETLIMCAAPTREEGGTRKISSLQTRRKPPNLEATSVSPALTVFEFPRISVEEAAYGGDGAG